MSLAIMVGLFVLGWSIKEGIETLSTAINRLGDSIVESQKGGRK